MVFNLVLFTVAIAVVGLIVPLIQKLILNRDKKSFEQLVTDSKKRGDGANSQTKGRT